MKWEKYKGHKLKIGDLLIINKNDRCIVTTGVITKEATGIESLFNGWTFDFDENYPISKTGIIKYKDKRKVCKIDYILKIDWNIKG